MTDHGTGFMSVSSHCIHLRVDDQTLEIRPALLAQRLPTTQIIAVEVPGDPAPRPVNDTRSFLSAMPSALATSPGKCGSFKGIRHLRKGAKGKRIVYFPSVMNAGSMQCESRLEADHAMAVEREHRVTRYRCQPFRIYFDGWSYTPDVLLSRSDGSISVREIKVLGKLEDPDLRVRLAIVQLALGRFGLPFEVRTEKNNALPTEETQLIYNRMNKAPSIALLTEACTAAMKEADVWRFTTLYRHLQALGFRTGSIERLLWERFLVASGSITTPERVTVRAA